MSTLAAAVRSSLIRCHRADSSVMGLGSPVVAAWPPRELQSGALAKPGSVEHERLLSLPLRSFILASASRAD
jgi:hypothetical protein